MHKKYQIIKNIFLIFKIVILSDELFICYFNFYLYFPINFWKFLNSILKNFFLNIYFVLIKIYNILFIISDINE